MIATPKIAQPVGKVILIGASSTSKAIVQEGLEALSEPNMMPFIHQYDLLNDVLRMLERACFFWAKKTIPDILKQKKWFAWQKVELLDWLDYFSALDAPLEIPPDVRAGLVGVVIPGLIRMRNDAIRRKELPIVDVIAMMQHSQALAKVLRDDACFKILITATERLIDSKFVCAVPDTLTCVIQLRIGL